MTQIRGEGSPAQPDTQNRATAALVVAAFLFGSTFLVVQDAIDRASVLAVPRRRGS